MKLVLEIGPRLLARLQTAVARGQYESISDLALLAIENQVSLELDAHSAGDPPPSLTLQTRSDHRVFVAPSDAATLSVSDHGWIWGIVNRVLPIKYAVRALLSAEGAAVAPLSEFAERTAFRAAEFARPLTKDGRDRHDAFATGFPFREPIYPAIRRFADYYVGRIENGDQPRGALFELGLAGLIQANDDAGIGVTELGADFARLANPVIDSPSATSSLSEIEARFYVERIASIVPRELDCFITLLGALSVAPLRVDALDDLVRQHLPKRFSPAAVQAQKAGAIGRLRDLALIDRKKMGVTARFDVTDLGREALAALIGKSGAQPTKRGARK